MNLFVIKGYEFYGCPIEFIIMAEDMSEAKLKLLDYANKKFDYFADINDPRITVEEVKGEIYQASSG